MIIMLSFKLIINVPTNLKVNRLVISNSNITRAQNIVAKRLFPFCRSLGVVSNLQMGFALETYQL